MEIVYLYKSVETNRNVYQKETVFILYWRDIVSRLEKVLSRKTPTTLNVKDTKIHPKTMVMFKVNKFNIVVVCGGGNLSNEKYQPLGIVNSNESTQIDLEERFIANEDAITVSKFLERGG